MVFLLMLAAGAADVDTPRYGVGRWPMDYGNHRARVWVQTRVDAVRASLPWRRRDPDVAAKNIVVVHANLNRPVSNRVRMAAGRERGEIVFEPEWGPGEYHIFCMPYRHTGPPHAFDTEYAAYEETADPAWRVRAGLDREDAWQALPRAELLEFQARTEFDRFDPMEVIATAEERRALLDAHPDAAYLVFPEDRMFPIRMADDLPRRWIESGPASRFETAALRGEHLFFQLGVFAARHALEDVRVEFTDLEGGRGARIPVAILNCINTGGVDWLGRPFEKTCRVDEGAVQAFWCGVRIPRELPQGHYRGLVTIRPANAAPTSIELRLRVHDDVREDGGVDDLWRHARLGWLDSTIGIDDTVTSPYLALQVDDHTIRCRTGTVAFGDTGFPDQIVAGDRELLAGPMRFTVETADGELALRADGPPRITSQTPATVRWTQQGEKDGLSLRTEAAMDYDGYINYRVSLSAAAPVDLADVRLEIPLRREVVRYMMGMGRKGGYRPAEWSWKWDVSRANNSVWLGDVDAGLQCKLKSPEDTWELYNFHATGLPDAWHNGGAGGCRMLEAGEDRVLLTSYSGPRRIEPGETLVFAFGLLITPVKPLNTAHWRQRYFHRYAPVSTAAATGASIINIHHGNELNPNINYPFIEVDALRAYVDEAHASGLKVKIYYTVRELSNRVAELWALRSLGTEVFADGPGGGYSWLREHLVSGYAPAWHEPNLPGGEVDGAIVTTGLSRWHNYYLEGLAWLLREVRIDGLYLDGIGYNREIMRRVRRVLDSTRAGCLIDFHSGNNFAPEYGLSSCANQYMEHFPYIDSLWFGEGFDYNESPDYWLVEISGIPFGLFGEMLEGGGNPWRGMVYGMTCRHYQNADPGPMWRLWDAFGIGDASMFGYWSPECPVRADRDDVLVTVYRRLDKALVALASWADGDVTCRLQIDWAALRIDADKAVLRAPAVAGVQDEAVFRPEEDIPVAAGRGWLLILEEE